jgi:hypothetical protein
MSEFEVPDACTLPTAAQPLRIAEFDDLFRSAVIEVRRVGRLRLRLGLTPEPEAAARAAGLAVRETACCSFFAFTLTASGGEVALEIAVPAAHVDVLDALATCASQAGA